MIGVIGSNDKKDYRCTDEKGDYTVYCTNMPQTVTEDELKQLFEPFGKLIAILPYKPRGKYQGVVFVKYQTREMAQKCIEKLNNTSYKNKLICLRYVNQKRPEKRLPPPPPPRFPAERERFREFREPDYYDGYPYSPAKPPRMMDRDYDLPPPGPVGPPPDPYYSRMPPRRGEIDDPYYYRRMDDYPPMGGGMPPPPPPHGMSRYEPMQQMYDDYDMPPPRSNQVQPPPQGMQMSSRYQDDMPQGQGMPRDQYDDHYAYERRPY